MHFCRAGLLTTCLASVALAAPTSQRATSRPDPAAAMAERRAESRANAAVASAARDLLREFGVASAGSKSATLRTTSDYFNEHHASDLTNKAVLAALDSSISNDPRAAAYVKWQLISGLQGAIEDNDLPRLLRIYHNAPAPIALPGETPEEQTKYELMRRNARKEDVDRLNEALAADQQQRQRDDEPVLAYRDELFARLPEQNYDCLRAGFEDAYTRMKAGCDPQKIADALVKRTHGWMASTNVTPQQLDGMSRLVMTLSKENSPDFYAEAVWSQRSYKVTWRRKSYDLNHYGQMEKLARELADAARSASSSGGGELKFKDETSKSSSNKKSNSSKSEKE